MADRDRDTSTLLGADIESHHLVDASERAELERKAFDIDGFVGIEHDFVSLDDEGTITHASFIASDPTTRSRSTSTLRTSQEICRASCACCAGPPKARPSRTRSATSTCCNARAITLPPLGRLPPRQTRARKTLPRQQGRRRPVLRLAGSGAHDAPRSLCAALVASTFSPLMSSKERKSIKKKVFPRLSSRLSVRPAAGVCVRVCGRRGRSKDEAKGETT